MPMLWMSQRAWCLPRFVVGARVRELELVARDRPSVVHDIGIVGIERSPGVYGFRAARSAGCVPTIGPPRQSIDKPWPAPIIVMSPGRRIASYGVVDREDMPAAPRNLDAYRAAVGLPIFVSSIASSVVTSIFRFHSQLFNVGMAEVRSSVLSGVYCSQSS